MNQDKFIKSFKEFNAKCHEFNKEEIIKLFEIWYNNENQWINIRNFNQKD